MKCIAIDPGLSTGIAIHKDDKYFTLTLSIEETHEGKLRELIAPCDSVVYEDFVGYKSHGMRVSAAGFETVRIIGRIIEQSAVLNKPIYKYAAQNRLSFLRKAKELAKTNQVINLRPTRHEYDALAHLLNHEYQMKQVAILQEIITAKRNAS